MFSKQHNSSSPTATVVDNQTLSHNIALLHSCERQRKDVCEEFRKLIKLLSEMNTLEKRLVDDLTSSGAIVTSEDDTLRRLIGSWNEFVVESGKNRQDWAINLNRTMVEPLKKFHVAYCEMKSATKRLEQLANDAVRFQQKVLEYQRGERTASNIMKLNKYESNLAEAQNDAKVLRGALEREVPVFLQKRLDYLQPSLSAFVCSSILYSGNTFTALKDLELVSGESTNQDRLEKQSKLFESIDNLSIISS